VFVCVGMVGVDLGLVPKSEAEAKDIGLEHPAVANAGSDGEYFDAFTR
jgi:hypothetical protein